MGIKHIAVLGKKLSKKKNEKNMTHFLTIFSTLEKLCSLNALHKDGDSNLGP
jgi:hypothetical protein